MLTLGLKKQAPFLEGTLGLDLHQVKLFLVANKHLLCKSMLNVFYATFLHGTVNEPSSTEK